MIYLTKQTGPTLLGRDGGSDERADFLTTADWARRLKVAKRTIFRWLDEGIIPPCDLIVGKVHRWHESTYRLWVSQRAGGN